MSDEKRTDANGLGLAAIQQNAARKPAKPVKNPLWNLRASEVYRLSQTAKAKGGIDIDETQQ